MCHYFEMRVEPHEIGSVMHVIKRGARGMEIVRDEADRQRFVRLLYLLNDQHQTADRHEHDIGDISHRSDLWKRPTGWPEREPLVAILAWTLMPNHFHLLLKEVREGGIAKFMQRFCGSMSMAFNEKYNERGSIFQGGYKGKLVDTDEYLRYVVAYIAVKNVLELYPGGLKRAVREYDRAWEWACTYPFASLSALMITDNPIIDIGELRALGLPGRRFKHDARDMLIGHMQTLGNDEHTSLWLEQW